MGGAKRVTRDVDQNHQSIELTKIEERHVLSFLPIYFVQRSRVSTLHRQFGTLAARDIS